MDDASAMDKDDEIRLRQALGGRIRALRQQCGLTQAALAEAVGVGQGHLARVERGARWLSLDGLYRVAGALGVPAAELVADSRDEPTSDLALLVAGCTDRQAAVVRDLVLSLRRHVPD